MFQRFVDFLQRLWARLSWTGGVHYLNGGPGLPPPLTPEEEKALLARMADGDPAARDELITHNLRLLLSDVLSSEADQVGQRLEQDAERANLRRSVEQLSPRERQIMELRFGLLDGVERTQKEVADAIGISQSYISRLEKRIIRQLREQLGE